jgi:hypothetical protein
MSMRLRPLIPVAVAFALGASLLRTSMAPGFSSDQSTTSLRFRSAAGHVASKSVWSEDPPESADSAVWAVPAPVLAAGSTAGLARTGPTLSAAVPDGLVHSEVVAALGARRPRAFLTNAVTVRQMLQAMQIRLARSDIVRPSLRATLYNGLRVRVIRIRTRIQTVTQSLPTQTLIRYSKELPPDTWRVLSDGSDGMMTLTYRVRVVNGKVVRRTLLSTALLSQGVPRVELRGAGEQPAPGIHVQYGQASWYECTGDYAAHLTLPKGTVVTVTNLDNGSTVTVIIDDRGPYGVPGRIIDLCTTAFAQIAPLAQGVANVQITW